MKRAVLAGITTIEHGTLMTEEVMDLMKQNDAKRDEMRSFMLDEVAKFHSILTPEQRNKAVDKMKEFRQKREDRREKRDDRKMK